MRNIETQSNEHRISIKFISARFAVFEILIEYKLPNHVFFNTFQWKSHFGMESENVSRRTYTSIPISKMYDTSVGIRIMHNDSSLKWVEKATNCCNVMASGAVTNIQNVLLFS